MPDSAVLTDSTTPPASDAIGIAITDGPEAALKMAGESSIDIISAAGSLMSGITEELEATEVEQVDDDAIGTESEAYNTVPSEDSGVEQLKADGIEDACAERPEAGSTALELSSDIRASLVPGC